MRRFLLAAAVAALAACQPASPPAPAGDAATTTPAPAVVSCNEIAPDASKPVLIAPPPPAAAALADNLRGGPLTPGTYDLTSGVAQGGAPSWTEAHAAAVNVADTDNGTVLNYAEARGGDVTRWTANFDNASPPTLAFTCGRTGQATIQYQSNGDELRLSIPAASGVGRYDMTFAKRA